MSICMHSVSVVDEVHRSSKSTDSLIKYYSNKNIKYSFSASLQSTCFLMYLSIESEKYCSMNHVYDLF